MEPRSSEPLQAARAEPERQVHRQGRKDLAETLSWLLDDAVRVPGTQLRIGLDGILGFVLPGAGDTLTASLALALWVVALKERLPAVALLRMAGNILFDVLVGLLPLVGDLADVGFKANRRNLEILRRYRAAPARKPSAGDSLVVAASLCVMLLALALPVLTLLWALRAWFG